MAGKLIKHLEMKAQEHPHLELLKSQWCFDQELIPKALQNVGTIFPHFSRHDASHSRQILINIERLLGDNLAKLTATDTWLLLESAYWHDIGMVVTASDINNDITSNDFKQFVREIADSKAHELHGFAKSFLDDKNPSCFSLSNHPYESVEKFRLLLADWYRKHHPKRAEKTVNDPWQMAGISSPRNELLPKRLFRLLGQICRLHGSGFNQVLSDLPFREAGMATEDCHPRFIACLLRLGDLFDLDDNRFCPVMLRMAGNIPDSSQAHIDKHAAIRHFRLDPECVEISAECEGKYAYEAYVAADQWFGWIKDELRDQMSRWKDIVPSREFGLLPTLGKMEVNLAPPHRLINPSERPRFEIDWEKGIELLQGASLYDRPEQAIRELLQNAVDSTLIRIWLEHKEDQSIDWTNPYADKTKELFNKYPIKVSLDKDSETNLWKLTITDQGIGISVDDLKFMSKVGSSSKNQRKKKIIAEMPEWMKPSGVFGIGFQSAFLLTGEVNIKTQNIFDHENLDITFTDPLSKRQGAIFISNGDKKFLGVGSKISFFINSDCFKKQNLSFGESQISSLRATSDPVTSIYPDAIELDIDKFVFDFREDSLINIENTASLLDEEQKIKHLTVDNFHEKTQIAASCLSVKRGFPSLGFQSLKIKFRGQLLTNEHMSFGIKLSGCINIMGLSANSHLDISRNKFKNQSKKEIEEYIKQAIAYFINNNKINYSDDSEKVILSSWLELHGFEQANDMKNQWRDIPSFTKNKVSVSIGDLLKIKRFQSAQSARPHFYWGGTDHADNTDDSEGCFITSSPILLSLLMKKWRENEGYIQYGHKYGSYNDTLLFQREKITPYSNSFFEEQLMPTNRRYPGDVRREIIAWDEYLALSFEIVEGKHFFYSPFVNKHSRITTENFDDLVNWTFEHRLDQKVTKEQIRETYEKFIDWVDNDLMKNSDKWDEWKALRGLKD